jgi:hypothetical protein
MLQSPRRQGIHIDETFGAELEECKRRDSQTVSESASLQFVGQLLEPLVDAGGRNLQPAVDGGDLGIAAHFVLAVDDPAFAGEQLADDPPVDLVAVARPSADATDHMVQHFGGRGRYFAPIHSPGEKPN